MRFRNTKENRKNPLRNCSRIQEIYSEVTQAFRKTGFTIILEKCDFGEIKGRNSERINRSVRHVQDSKRVKPMKKLATPANKQELRTVLGLA